MLTRVGLLAFTFAASQLVAPLMRESNSAARVRRGIEQYEKRQHQEALQSFEEASRLSQNPRTSFNLGTAQVAAGQFAEGARLLTKSLEEEAIRPDAYYNRGNSALAANALDHAVRDYESALKLRPSDPRAKRNLEIALQRKQAAQRPQPRPTQQPSPQQPRDQEEQPSPGDGQGEETQQADAEALLRSVEQQEREELSRMHRARADQRRVGW